MLLVCSMLHLSLNRRISRNSGMPLIKALSRDFTSVIDPHQSRGVRLLLVCELRLTDLFGWIGSRGPSCGRGNGSQRIIKA